MDSFNYTMLCDYYELTMGSGYFESGMKDKITYFDLFFRKVPDNGGFAICAGLSQVIEYIKNLHFSEEDIEDCVADSFCEFWESLERFELSKGSIRAWLSKKYPVS